MSDADDVLAALEQRFEVGDHVLVRRILGLPVLARPRPGVVLALADSDGDLLVEFNYTPTGTVRYLLRPGDLSHVVKEEP